MTSRVSTPTDPRSTKSATRAEAMLRELTRTLEREATLVEALRDVLQRQRGGVARNDTAAVQSSCDEIGRLLTTIEAAREGRANALQALTGDESLALSHLEAALGRELPEELARARQRLRAAAAAAASETATNHVVLERTLEAGEAFLQTLFASASDPDPVYRASERHSEGDAGFLVDRKA